MLFSLLKHLELYIANTALKVSRSLYCFTTSISRGVENYFPRLWGMGISDAIFLILGHSKKGEKHYRNSFYYPPCDIFALNTGDVFFLYTPAP